MIADFTWKQGDTRPPMRALLTEPDPLSTTTPQGRRGISLLQATTVTMRMSSRDRRTLKVCPAVPDPEQENPTGGDAHKSGRGWVTMDPAETAGFTAVAGWFDAEFPDRLVGWRLAARPQRRLVQRRDRDRTVSSASQISRRDGGPLAIQRERVHRHLQRLAKDAPSSLAAHAALFHRSDDGRPLVPKRHHLEWIRILQDRDRFRWVVIVAPPGYAKIGLDLDRLCLLAPGRDQGPDPDRSRLQLGRAGGGIRQVGSPMRSSTRATRRSTGSSPI